MSKLSSAFLMIKLFCIEIEVGLARPLSFSSFSFPFFGLFPAFLALAVKFNLPPVLVGELNFPVFVGDYAFKVPCLSNLMVFLLAPGDSSLVAPKSASAASVPASFERH